MLKIILWRLLYNLFCLMKCLGYQGKRVYYFAFGANLDPKVLNRRNITPHNTTQYTMRDYNIEFNHEVPFKGMGMASIEPAAGGEVPGFIYEIDGIDEKRLDCMEAHIILNRYDKEFFIDEQNHEVYFYKTNRKNEGLLPSREYLGKILKGYNNIEPKPKEFIEKLSNHRTVDEKVFRNEPHFMIKNYEYFGKLFRSVLIVYDRLCVKFFAYLIFKPSLFEQDNR